MGFSLYFTYSNKFDMLYLRAIVLMFHLLFDCSPEGRKFRSKTELEAHIKKYSLSVNVSDFCFTVRGQHLLDIAANCNGQWHKRKRCASQEVAIDGRLDSTTNDDVGDAPQRRKRMKLWDGHNANKTKASTFSVDSDCLFGGTSKKECRKNDSKNKLLILSHLQTAKESKSEKDIDALKNTDKTQKTKRSRVSQKLTVRMKFMPSSPKSVKIGGLKSRSSSHLQISKISGSAVTKDGGKILIPNGNTSPNLSTCKVVSTQNGPRHRKNAAVDQRDCFSVSRHVSSVGGCPSDVKHDQILLQQGIANGDDSSTDVQWIPPQSPFNLVEESLFHSSWKILIASIILENGQGYLASCL